MDVSVVVTAIATSARLRLFVESFQRIYPDLPIYVGAQGKLEPPPDDIASKRNVHWLELPFDYGLSATRNFLVRQTRSEFILLCDDDFVFLPGLALENSLGLFKKYCDLGVIGGRHTDFEYDTNGHINSVGNPQVSAHQLIHDRDAKVLILVPAFRVSADRLTHAGYEFVFCDYVLNFSMIRKSLVFGRGVAWDEVFKTSGEHVGFFLSLKSIGGCRVAYYSGLFAEHHRFHNNAYSRLRSRGALDQVAFFEKLGIEWRVRILERIVHLENGALKVFPFDRLNEVMSDAPEALGAVQQALARFLPSTDDT